LSGGRLEIIEADALDINLADIVAAPRAILANLPYNIATPLLLQWLKQSEDFKHMTLMFQKEVAQRLIAAPGTKAYGRLSVIAGWRCNVRTLFDLPPSAFTPPPKVTSTVVQLTPRQIPENSPSFESMEQITAKAFGQRRKMLRKNFDHLEELGIPETARAEELSIQDFIALARRL